MIITHDYNSGIAINPDALQDLNAIADVEISNITLDDYPNLLVFPDSFRSFDRDFGKKVIFEISSEGTQLKTNSIVGFIGRNQTHLSIYSRFADNGKEDYFLHYMLQKVAKVNLFSLQHTMDEDSVFDFLVYLFPLYLKKAINQGIYRKYITRNFNDANLRGLIDVNRHIRYNEPFNGKIAYRTREYSYDNEVTQLIRHTIEFIRKYKGGFDILNIDSDTYEAVCQIISATPSFVYNEIQTIINKNLKPIVHPYYSEYTSLQRLCLQILRHEELKYGQQENVIYGVLIDAAWLWEEYINVVFEEHNLNIKHPRNTTGEGVLYLGKNRSFPRFPDFYNDSHIPSFVLDAKYKPSENVDRNDQNQMTTYLYMLKAKFGGFIMPDKFLKELETYDLVGYGENFASIGYLYLHVPQKCIGFQSFKQSIKTEEERLIDSIKSLCLVT